MDILEFLTAQLDEDERVARAAAAETAESWESAEDNGVLALAPNYPAIAVGPYGYMVPSVSEHVAAQDPARVLAEVAAKRVLAQSHRRNENTSAKRPLGYCDDCTYLTDNETQVYEPWPCLSLRALAHPYASRPGWVPGWAFDLPYDEAATW